MLSVMAAVSCTERLEIPESQTGSDGDVRVSVTFDEGGIQTKSSYTASESGISNLCLFVFNASGTRVFGQYYTSTTGISFSLPAGTYTFQAVANMGDITSSVTSRSAYDSYLYTFTNASLSKAFPMSGGGSKTISASSSSVSISLVRLVAKYSLRISKDGIRKGSLSVNSVTLKNIAGTVKPSGPYGVTASSQLIASGDSSSSSDVSALNSGGLTVFYVPENMQGTESSITASRDKVPEHNYSSVRSGLCTYLEVACSYFNGSDELDDVVYRMYLGANATSSFDIARNTGYAITLAPDSDHIHDGTWKCDSDVVAQVLLVSGSTGSTINPSNATVAENCFIAVRDASGNLLPVASCTSSDSRFSSTLATKSVAGKSARCADLLLNNAGTANYHIRTTSGIEFDYAVTASKPVVTVSNPGSALYLDGAAVTASVSWKKADGTAITPSSFFNSTAAQTAFVTPGIVVTMASAYRWTNMSGSLSMVLSTANRATFQKCVGAKFASASSLGQVQLYVKGYDSGNLKTMLDGLQVGGYFSLAGYCNLSSPNFTNTSTFTAQVPWTNKTGTRYDDIHDYSLIPAEHLKSGLSHGGTVSNVLPVRFASASIPVSVTLDRSPYPAYSSSITYFIPAGGTALKYSFDGYRHPAGRHTVKGVITNSVSGESIEVNLGYMECYTHIPVGSEIIINSIGQGGPYYDQSSYETLYAVDMNLFTTFPWQTSSTQDYPIYYLYTQMKSSPAYKAMIQGTDSYSSELYHATRSTGLENRALQWMNEYEVDWYPGAFYPPTLVLSETYVVNGVTYSGDIGRISEYLTSSNASPLAPQFYYTELFAYKYSLYDFTGTTSMGKAGNSARYAHMGDANYKDGNGNGYYILERMNASTKYHDLYGLMYSPK